MASYFVIQNVRAFSINPNNIFILDFIEQPVEKEKKNANANDIAHFQIVTQLAHSNAETVEEWNIIIYICVWRLYIYQ